MTELTHTNPPPWYKQFWPWYLIFLPASAVVAGISTVIIAMNNRDPMVVDNYYKEGLAINRVISQQQMAAKLGLLARTQYNAATGQLEIKIDNSLQDEVTSLNLSFVHATRADLDKKFVLHKDKQGIFRAAIKNIDTGKWNVFLEPTSKQWRLDAKVIFPTSQWVFKPDV